MRIEVLLGEAPVASIDVADRVVVVVDVLRAATSVATALAHGARAVIPFETADETVTRAKAYARGEVKMAGERRMVKIAGFDLGNSPAEYTVNAVDGRVILYSTTNGTVALAATHGARACFFAAFVNVAATVDAVRRSLAPGGDVLLVCSGHERRVALEDVVCAGRMVRLLAAAVTPVRCGDGARLAEMAERPYADSVSALAVDAAHAIALEESGYGDDVRACLVLDQFDRAVRYHDRQLRFEPTTVEAN